MRSSVSWSLRPLGDAVISTRTARLRHVTNNGPEPERRCDLAEGSGARRRARGARPVLIVQTCPAGTEAGCAALANIWSAQLTAQAAGTVRIIRAEAASAALVEWMATREHRRADHSAAHCGGSRRQPGRR